MKVSMWPLVVVAIVVVVLLLLLRGSPELAKLEVQRGSVRLVRGRLPVRLFHDFEDILESPVIEKAEVRIVVENGQPRVLASGLDEARQQQLRNVLGTYTVAQLRAGQRRAARR
jgi:hypothetical protein